MAMPFAPFAASALRASICSSGRVMSVTTQFHAAQQVFHVFAQKAVAICLCVKHDAYQQMLALGQATRGQVGMIFHLVRQGENPLANRFVDMGVPVEGAADCAAGYAKLPGDLRGCNFHGHLLCTRVQKYYDANLAKILWFISS